MSSCVPISSIQAEATTQACIKNTAPAKISFAFLSLETSDESCWCFKKGSVGMVCRRSATRLRVRTKVASSLWTFRTTEPSGDCSAPARHFRQRTVQTGRRSDSSKLRQGRKAQGTHLEPRRTTDASTQESSNNATSCTSWFSPAAHSRRRANRSATPSCPKLTGVPSGHGSSSLRVGPPPGRQNHGIGSVREVVTIGAWLAALRHGL